MLGLVGWRGLLELVLLLLHPLELVERTAHASKEVLDCIAVFTAGADAAIVLAVQVVVEQAVPVPLQRYLYSLVADRWRPSRPCLARLRSTGFVRRRLQAKKRLLDHLVDSLRRRMEHHGQRRYLKHGGAFSSRGEYMPRPIERLD